MVILENKRIVVRVIVDKKDEKNSFGLCNLTRSLSLASNNKSVFPFHFIIMLLI